MVLLGDSSVGKTSLVHRFTSGSFNPHSANTIGAAFISKEYTHKNRTVKFEIWDTAGQERYKSLTPMYYRNALVALVCFDLSLPESSFERAKYWIDQLLTMGPSDIRIFVVGNKLDMIRNAEANVEANVEELIGNVEDLTGNDDKATGNDDNVTRNANNMTGIVNHLHLLPLIEEYCNDKRIVMTKTSAKLGTGITELFDSIVDGIDQQSFDNHSQQVASEVPEEGVLLNFRDNAARCC